MEMYDIIVIGGGPAGITAGIYASRKNLKATLIAKDFIGQLGNAGVIENWPGKETILGPELMADFLEHLEKYNIEIKEEKVAEITKNKDFFKVITDKKEEYQSRAIIIATGRNPRPLKVKGEKEFVGKGVSYCVTCDGALFKDKDVAVIGGGNSALEGALELSEYAKNVYVVEILDNLQGDEFLIKRLKERTNITILTNNKVTEIKGDKFVDSVLIENKEKNKSEFKVSGIFVQIGSIPATEITKDLVDYNDFGDIKIDKNCKTKTEGVFAAGDVSDVRDKQIIVAAGEGCKALLSAYKYLKN